ncbi:SixA phosphatase family protein [Dokdonia sp. Hel_I_53]|uniref:SixA phosphatase family protein n=1 Tax=Dokdonia sp. Hel_I_53 TaxID=1566287 RepID=UPI00119A2D27|nr:histidine phosphatase family protein [Dokdonia sp. Hel_I_53]TVZ50934.1 histidine phosphatase superfamily protein (branch 1) [Dokdonia sp. Hel_I_53]
MKKCMLLVFLAVVSINCDGQKKNTEPQLDKKRVVTTYYFIRHAEKDLSNPSSHDPELTKEGKQRAEEWKAFFKNKGIDAVYSTDFKRTMSTAQPTAIANGISIKTYDPANLYSSDFEEETKGKNVVVVGHSNTTAQFANAILERKEAPEIDESDYGNLYIVTKTNDKITFSKKHFN